MMFKVSTIAVDIVFDNIHGTRLLLDQYDYVFCRVKEPRRNRLNNRCEVRRTSVFFVDPINK
jgi:hypothetical protein